MLCHLKVKETSVPAGLVSNICIKWWYLAVCQNLAVMSGLFHRSKFRVKNNTTGKRVKAFLHLQRSLVIFPSSNFHGRILIGTVRIITEPELPGALEGAQLSSRNRLRPIPPQLRQPSGLNQDVAWLREKRKRHLASAHWTWLPPWVYEMYDAVSHNSHY